jgi:hypothetical protein
VAELTFPDVAHIRVDLAALQMVVSQHPQADRRDLAPLMVDHVIPRVAADASLVLHAAGVVVDGAATLLVGAGGAGKSTLATRWCLEGGCLLGDDTVRIEQAAALPSYVGPRLWPSSLQALGLRPTDGRPATSFTEKRRLGPDEGIVLAEAEAPVRRIVVLGPPRPRASRLDAVRALMEQALNLGHFDPVALLDRVTSLVDSVQEVEFRPPWDTPPE